MFVLCKCLLSKASHLAPTTTAFGIEASTKDAHGLKYYCRCRVSGARKYDSDAVY